MIGLLDADHWGLSPPVRGSLVIVALLVLGLGSIPARAGEPLRSANQAQQEQVYPRPCGGAPPGGVL